MRKIGLPTKPLAAATVVIGIRVRARSKSGATMLRRHRNNGPTRESVGAQGPQPDRPAAERSCANHATASPADERPLGEPPTPAPARGAQRRLEPATEDQAMYSCECGFIFQAAVSTSVGCPHCGGSQAW
jgi:hypothetical protein